MARLTKADLEKKIEDRDAIINILHERINKLEAEKDEILEGQEVVTKAEHEGILNELERIKINYKTLNELNEKLNNKVAAYKNGHSNFIRQLELNTENEKILNDHIALLEKRCEDLKKDNNTLEVYMNKLEEENKELKAENRKLINNETVKKHNERGAGRKSNLTEEQLEKIKELHQEGLSYGAIAKEVGISKAYVYKLINKQ